MNMPYKRKVCFKLCIVLILALAKTGHAKEYSNFPGVFHIHSTVSDGRYPIEKLMALADEKGIKVVVLTDCLLRRWEYGIWPLRNLIKRKIEENSVLKFGVKDYLKKVDEAQRDFPHLVILPGLEVSPFCFWQGSPFRGDATFYNWHERMLVMGLNKEDYKTLPVVSNYSLLPNRWGNLYQFWPISTIFLGIWLARKRRKRQFLLRGQRFSFYSYSYKYIGYIIVGFSIIWLVNNLNFPVAKYDQYHGNQGIKPYQDLIDYVNQKGGLVFWAHPEAAYSGKFGGINVYTPDYPEDLVTAHNYTGFASLYQDNITITEPANIWDQILIQYCEGKRERPIWGVGEIVYHDNSKEIDAVQTIFLLPQLNREAVLEALKKGRLYAKRSLKEKDFSNDFSLDRFALSDSIGDEWGYMGDEVICQAKPRLHISGSCSTHPEEVISIQLIRCGEVIKVFEVKGLKFDIEFEDDYFRPEEKIYYRLNITAPHSIIVSNPIFVKFFKGSR